MSIRDLARHLNVSIGTVSRALNGKTDVNPETRRRVLAAAEALGYSPNQSGRSLRQGQTGMIALLIPTSAKMELADTIFMTVLEGLRAYLRDKNLDLMVLLSGDGDEAEAYLRRTAGRRLADGMIIAQTQRKDPRIDFLIAKQIPFVAFGRSRSGGTHSWIDLDFEGVAAAAVDRLVGFGHRRIALATTVEEINYGYIFSDAYRRRLRHHGIAVDPDLVFRVENSEDGGYDFGARLLASPKRPTAALMVNVAMVIGLYRRLIENGVRPGADLSIIGFQEEAAARFLSPQVTCFRADLKALGSRFGDALLAVLRGGDGAPPVQEIWPMTLVRGESDGPPRT